MAKSFSSIFWLLRKSPWLISFVLLYTILVPANEYSIPLLSPESPDFGLEHTYKITDPQFKRVIGNLLGPTITRGNEIDTLINGDQIFPSMLKAISEAERSITFETFIYWESDIGRTFSEALSIKARAGIPVHLMLDWIGSDSPEADYIKSMKAAGVEIKYYNPIPWYNPFRYYKIANINYRTHRKLLVVDGKIGFSGGVGIGDKWTGNAQDPDHWRDTHYRVSGPVVAQLQSAFIDNWLEVGSSLIDDERYFPEIRESGDVEIQAFKSSPTEATAHLELMMRMALTAASQSIRLSTPYFVPNEGTVKTLIDARKRGVSIDIIVPGDHLDQDLVHYASRIFWGELLEAGVNIYRYKPTMYHTKLLVIDEYFSSIGSANFDNRSFHLNDEANLNVFNHEFAKQQITNFNFDMKNSERYTLDDWRKRSFWERTAERLSTLISAHL